MEQDTSKLENAIIYAGFSEVLIDQIMGEAMKGEKEFSVYDRKTFKGSTVDYELKLKMPEDPEKTIPYLKGFQATLKDDPTKTQYFDYFQDTRFTSIDAYELLTGQVVTKSFSIDFAHQDKNNNHYLSRKKVVMPEENQAQRLPRTQGEPLPETSESMGRHI